MDVPRLTARLKEAYPQAECALLHEDPYQLLVATILSAQCTDARVNMVTPALFARFPGPEAMAKAEPKELEALIRSTGFYRNKAKSILGSSRRIVDVYGGSVPRRMEDLLTLPGVARKTANVVLGSGFGIAEGIAVDTHVDRIAHRLGLTRGKNPEQVERDLMKAVPQAHWTLFSHLLIHHGRQICFARKPRCGECSVRELCPAAPLFLSGKMPARERRRRETGRGRPGKAGPTKAGPRKTGRPRKARPTKAGSGRARRR